MNKKLISMLLSMTLLSTSVLVSPVVTLGEEINVPAFPGAQGGGKYTKGARNVEKIQVQIVNSLYDGPDAKSKPGTLRYAASKKGSIIVFEVSGVIDLYEPLSLVENTTILGQTAPGEGITISTFGTKAINRSELIVRYLKFRAGSKLVEQRPDDAILDALSVTKGTNIILDHLSTSWSTDETFSIYGGKNVTVSNCIIAESLTMSGHAKGRHGYGGIWGGSNATFINNLLTSHTSRNPRVEVGGNSTPATVDIRNNVMYNWGFNAAYGGDQAEVNLVNNYFKPGPGTTANVAGRLANPGVADRAGICPWYVNGNYLVGNPEVTADNEKGVVPAGGKSQYVKLETPVAIEGAKPENYTTMTAEEAYEYVLANAGANFPKRDAYDARIINDTKNGTGRFINTEWEVGGYPKLEEVKRPEGWDTDRDGLPDVWELENGLNPADKTDSVKINPNTGYTYLEDWANGLIPDNLDSTKENPIVTTTLKQNQYIDAHKDFELKAIAQDADGIERVEFTVGDRLKKVQYLGEATPGANNEYTLTWQAPEPGMYYVIATAYDKKGHATQTTSLPVQVVDRTLNENWSTMDIGQVKVPGQASSNEEGTAFNIRGAGTISGKNDSFHYVYQEIEGDTTITAKIDHITAVDNLGVTGLMIRDSLESDAKFAMANLSYRKVGSSSDTSIAAYLSSRSETGTTADSPMERGDSGTPEVKTVNMPVWLRLDKNGYTFTLYISEDGQNFRKIKDKTVEMGEKIYVGFAVDGADNGSSLARINESLFSDVVMEVREGQKPPEKPSVVVSEEEGKIALSIKASEKIGKKTLIVIKSGETGDVVYLDQNVIGGEGTLDILTKLDQGLYEGYVSIEGEKIDISGFKVGESQPEPEIDEEAPVLIYSGDTTLNVANGGVFNTPEVTAEDNKDEQVEVIQSIKNSKGEEISKIDTKVAGTYTITYTAKDAAGNEAKPLVVTVVVAEKEIVPEPEIDEEAPVLIYSGDTTLNVANGGVFNTPEVTAEDNKDEQVEVIQSIKNSKGEEISKIDTKVAGTYTITYTAKDAAGNEAKPLVITVVVGVKVDSDSDDDEMPSTGGGGGTRPTPTIPTVEEVTTEIVIDVLKDIVLKDNQQIKLSVVPYLEKGRMMAGIRDMSMLLDIEDRDIVWDNTTKTVTIKSQDICLMVGKTYALVKGEKVELGVAPQIINGRMVLPVAQIGRLLGKEVKFDTTSKKVTIVNKHTRV